MKTIRISSFTIVILIVLLIGVDDTLANWYAGAKRTVDANGITALISTTNDPLYLVEMPLSGESNWVSTYDVDQNGKMGRGIGCRQGGRCTTGIASQSNTLNGV
jgi:hypothetical protein